MAILLKENFGFKICAGHLSIARWLNVSWQLVPKEWCSDWKGVSTDGCELERRHKQLLWWWGLRNEVGGDRVGRRRELAGSDRVVLDRVIHEMPWAPPWSRPAVVDAASAGLQGRLWHGRSGVDETPNELEHWEWTEVAAVDMPEAWPGRNCHSRAWSVGYKRHNQWTKAVVGDVTTKVTKLAEHSKAAWHSSPNVSGRSEMAVLN